MKSNCDEIHHLELNDYIKEEWKAKITQYGLSSSKPQTIMKQPVNSEKPQVQAADDSQSVQAADDSQSGTSESLNELLDDSSWLRALKLIKTNSRTKRYILGRVVRGIYYWPNFKVLFKQGQVNTYYLIIIILGFARQSDLDNISETEKIQHELDDTKRAKMNDCEYFLYYFKIIIYLYNI